MHTHAAPSVKPHSAVVALYRVPVCQTVLVCQMVVHAFDIVHVLDSKCARVHVCCAHKSCFVIFSLRMLTILVSNFFFSNCPVQSGKNCLETTFVIVLACSNRSRCFASAFTDHSPTPLFFHRQGPCRQSKLCCTPAACICEFDVCEMCFCCILNASQRI